MEPCNSKLAQTLTIATVSALLVGCSTNAGSQFTPTNSMRNALAFPQNLPRRNSGGALGPILTTPNQGTITGWDVDASNDYGLLSAGYKRGTRLEVFDLKTAKITLLGSRQRPFEGSDERQFVVLKILANKLGLVDDVRFNPNNFHRTDTYLTLNPANQAKVTGKWTPPNNPLVQWVSYNQSTSTNAMFMYGPGLSLRISDVATNSFEPAKVFPRNQVFQVPDLVAQDTRANLAIVPTQLFLGSIFDPFEAPSFNIYGLSKKTHSIFSPNVGSGPAQGIAIDSTTHMMCTTTGDDSNVEFYDLQRETGFAVGLPNGSGEGTGGGAVAVDEPHHLFIVTQPAGFLASASVYVYNEKGALQESIGGFNFSNRFAAVFAYVAVNPQLRIGYTSTANADQLQSFAY